MTNKKHLSERDICTKYITPALEASGWDIQSELKQELIKALGSH
jgi:type I restriction enzyme R subunit